MDSQLVRGRCSFFIQSPWTEWFPSNRSTTAITASIDLPACRHYIHSGVSVEAPSSRRHFEWGRKRDSENELIMFLRRTRAQGTPTEILKDQLKTNDHNWGISRRKSSSSFDLIDRFMKCFSFNRQQREYMTRISNSNETLFVPHICIRFQYDKWRM